VVEPFRIHVPEAALEDLRTRLARTRLPDALPDAGWTTGADLGYMRSLIAYWLAGFDWRAQEARLNAFTHVRVPVQGIRVHAIHERGRGPRPLPLVITHGWPGSFTEMLTLIPLLADPATHGADPADAFDVVVPSIPGFGFSDTPAEAGWSSARVGDLWADLMTALGYYRFGAQGGDFGAGVATRLGLRHAARLVGLHFNYVPGSYAPFLGDGATPPTDEERAFLHAAQEWSASEGGYQHLQATKPQTPAFALTDSPVGLAAWIVEKFHDWGDCRGDIETRFSKDDLLTNIAVYWFTGTIGSSMRLYYESRRAPFQFAAGDRVRVPCGFARFPLEDPFPPRSWVERGYDVQRWSELPSGGHFAAMEEPQMLAADIRAFFRPLRGR